MYFAVINVTDGSWKCVSIDPLNGTGGIIYRYSHGALIAQKP